MPASHIENQVAGKNTNAEMWRKTGQSPIGKEIQKRKWGWIGHTLRKPTSNITREVLDWNPQGKRKVVRPKQTWKRSVVSEAEAAGLSWTQLGGIAQNRVQLKSVVAPLL